MESSCIEQLQATQQSLFILRLVGPDLYPTITSYLRKKKSSFIARRIVSKMMMMNYIPPSKWQAVYKKAARMDTCPALCQNIDSIIDITMTDEVIDAKTIDMWHYHLTL